MYNLEKLYSKNLLILFLTIVLLLSKFTIADSNLHKEFADLYLRVNETQTYLLKDYFDDSDKLSFGSNSTAVTFKSEGNPTYKKQTIQNDDQSTC